MRVDRPRGLNLRTPADYYRYVRQWLAQVKREDQRRCCSSIERALSSRRLGMDPGRSSSVVAGVGAGASTAVAAASVVPAVGSVSSLGGGAGSFTEFVMLDPNGRWFDALTDGVLAAYWQTVTGIWTEVKTLGLQASPVGVDTFPALLLFAPSDFADVRVEVTISDGPGAGDDSGLVLRSDGASASASTYAVALNSAGVNLNRWDSGVATLLGTSAGVVTGDKVRVDVVADSLKVYVNEVLVISATDAVYTRGLIGFYQRVNITNPAFSNLQVTRL